MKHYCSHLLNDNDKLADYKYTIIYIETGQSLSAKPRLTRVCMFTLHIPHIISKHNVNPFQTEPGKEHLYILYMFLVVVELQLHFITMSAHWKISFPFKCLFSFLAYRFVDYFKILRALNSNWRFFKKMMTLNMTLNWLSYIISYCTI